MAFALPRTLTLPSGSRVTLRRSSKDGINAVRTAEGAPLFSEVIALLDGSVELVKDGQPLDVHDLPLADFHVIRGVLTKAGLVAEDEVELDCHNCGGPLVARPCAGLETGPWEDAEATDPELDRLPELGVPLQTSPIRLGRVRTASSVTLEPRTVREAMPLFEALGRDPFVLDADVVRAMGIKAIGTMADPNRMTDPHAVAEALTNADEVAFGIVTDVFIEAHYPLRLACDVFCPKCKARSTVDAPAQREFELSPELDPESVRTRGSDSFPPLEEFVELAHAIAEPLIAEVPGEEVELIVESGTPAVDDGGELLLGAYLPPPPKDAPVPTQPPTVTLFYRTFEKEARRDPSFDWKGELRETIEHELEHHVYWLRGDDPMDAAEHDEIDREVVRVIGRDEAARRTLAVFGLSIPVFVRRAWPLIVIGALALAIGLAEGTCDTVTSPD
jgi:hypothetical protein